MCYWLSIYYIILKVEPESLERVSFFIFFFHIQLILVDDILKIKIFNFRGG